MGTVKINEAEKERLSLPLTALDDDHVAQDIKSKSEIPRITDGIYEVAIQEIMDKPPKEAEPEILYEQAGAGVEKETEPKRPEAAPREETKPESVLHKKAEEENPARRDDHPEGSSRKAEAAKAESSKPAAKVHKPAQPEASSTEKERESSRKAAASEPERKPAPAKARARKPEEEGKRTIVRPAAEKKKPEALHPNAAAESVSRKIPAAEKKKPIDDLNVSHDQINGIEDLIRSGECYPEIKDPKRGADHTETYKFLVKLAKAFKWRTYENGTLGAGEGDSYTKLSWYAVLLIKWMQG